MLEFTVVGYDGKTGEVFCDRVEAEYAGDAVRVVRCQRADDPLSAVIACEFVFDGHIKPVLDADGME